MLTVIILNLKKKWKNGLEPSKLAFGKNLSFYLILPVAMVMILMVWGVLNCVLGLGGPLIEFNISSFFITLIPTLIFYFFTIWTRYFGEELGWRIYLQDRLFPILSGYKVVLVLGIIWGAWYLVMNALGYNFQDQPILGNILMVIFTIAMGIILSYAVLKTGSIWLAVIIHMINNKASGIVAAFIGNSSDALLGNILMSVLLTVLALILLRSKVWKMVEKVPTTD